MAAVSVLDVSFKLLFKKSVTILPLPTVDKRANPLVLLAAMSKIEHFKKNFYQLERQRKDMVVFICISLGISEASHSFKASHDLRCL